MAWDSIVNQLRVKKLLRNALERNRLAHALLFTGLEGSGKDAMAIELADTDVSSRSEEHTSEIHSPT